MKLTRSEWTPERMKLLARLWKAGLSSNEIAKRFELSRAAVMGKVNRMNMMGIDRDATLKQKKQQAKKKKPERVRKRHPVILIHLKPDGCKFAVTPDTVRLHWFCNEPSEEGSPYCRRHHAKCYGRPAR